MLKYLLLLVFFWLLWWGWRQRQQPRRRGRPAAAPERMVTCAHCGVHLPESDALAAGERHYCHLEHQRAAERREE